MRWIWLCGVRAKENLIANGPLVSALFVTVFAHKDPATYAVSIQNLLAAAVRIQNLRAAGEANRSKQCWAGPAAFGQICPWEAEFIARPAHPRVCRSVSTRACERFAASQFDVA